MNGHAAVLVAVMALVTILLRFLPFLVFRRKTPAYVSYLGEVLPPAIIAMLVVYCLKDADFTRTPFGIPEFLAGAAVVALHLWKKNALLSILSGTAIYMILIRIML